MMTAPPKTSIIKAKIQNRKGDIFLLCYPERSEGSLTSSLITLEICVIQASTGRFVALLGMTVSFLFVPFQNDSVHHPADLEQLVFVMHHVFASESGDGVIFSQINRLFGADFLAHAAKNAAHHVDIEFFRVFFHLGETVAL